MLALCGWEKRNLEKKAAKLQGRWLSQKDAVYNVILKTWEGKFNELQKGRYINYASIKVI